MYVQLLAAAFRYTAAVNTSLNSWLDFTSVKVIRYALSDANNLSRGGEFTSVAQNVGLMFSK